MKRHNKLTSQQKQEEQQQQQAGELLAQPSAGMEFATPEELLRYDGKKTEVPPGIAAHLQDSLDKLPPPKGWWRRFLGS